MKKNSSKFEKHNSQLTVSSIGVTLSHSADKDKTYYDKTK